MYLSPTRAFDLTCSCSRNPSIHQLTNQLFLIQSQGCRSHEGIHLQEVNNPLQATHNSTHTQWMCMETRETSGKSRKSQRTQHLPTLGRLCWLLHHCAAHNGTSFHGNSKHHWRLPVWKKQLSEFTQAWEVLYFGAANHFLRWIKQVVGREVLLSLDWPQLALSS